LLKKQVGASLYSQLIDIIKNRIENKIYLPGTNIPSESSLQKEFNISRSTVRKALSILSEENILTKVPGRGTFVTDKEKIIETNNNRFLSFTKNIINSGRKLDTKLIYTKIIDTSTNFQSFFNNESQQLIEIKRLRFLDGIPFCVEFIWLPEKFKSLEDEDLDGSLYKILINKYQVKPNNGKKTFKIAYATQEESFLLDVTRGSALMLIQDFVYDEDGTPLHISKQILRGDKFTYAIEQ
jgi:GntR family transcriptional regulator